MYNNAQFHITYSHSNYTRSSLSSWQASSVLVLISIVFCSHMFVLLQNMSIPLCNTERSLSTSTLTYCMVIRHLFLHGNHLWQELSACCVLQIVTSTLYLYTTLALFLHTKHTLWFSTRKSTVLPISDSLQKTPTLILSNNEHSLSRHDLFCT